MTDDDGIYRGWHVIVGCFVGVLVVFGVSYSFGVFLTPIQRDLDLSRSGVSLIFSLQTAVVYVAAVVLGIAADRYGVRRMLGFGALAFAVGVVGTTLTRSIPMLFFAYGIVTAVGLGAVYVVSYATVPRWFQRRRGLASGIATAGLGLGMVAVPSAASALIARLGWRSALLVIAACATVALLAATRLIADTPVENGVDVSREFPGGYPDQEPVDWATYRSELVAIASSRRFLLVFAGWVCIYATMYVVFVHLVAHADDMAVRAGTGVLALAIIGATTSVARIVVGAMSDRIGRIRTFVACSLLMALSTLGLPVVSSRLGLGAFAVLFGIGYGGNGALLSPSTADFFGQANPNAVFGLVSLSFTVSGTAAPWAAGAVYDATGTYTLAFLGAGTVGIVGAGLVAVAGREAGTL